MAMVLTQTYLEPRTKEGAVLGGQKIWPQGV
jgi:hypothetical protein